MKYAFIHEHSQQFRIRSMARVLGVSRSGFYDWRAQPAGSSASERRRAAIDEPVHAEFFRKKQRYGGPRLTRELAQQGIVLNEKTVQASLARQQLCALAGRKFKVTTNSNHNLPVAPNRLEQDFSAQAPNEKWVGDITYLWTSEGWLYLAMFLDLYSRAVVGWSMASHMRAELVCDALRMALWRRQMPEGTIVHTDQGVQYCSNDFQQLLRDHKMLSSMSARGNCFDNAAAESFFHSLKVEAIHGERIATRNRMRETVFEYIEMDYNRTRQHSANGYISPEAFEAKTVA